MTNWLNKHSTKTNEKYKAPFDREKQLIELEELFIKFDFDGSGTLDLDELVSMFQMVGLRIPSNQLKKMFHLVKDAKIVKEEVDKEGFQRLMMSPALNKAFRVMLRDVRNRVKYNDFSLVDPEVSFLPTDLSLMLGYLYKRSIRNNLTEGISSDKDNDFMANQTPQEVFDQIQEDLERFTNLFHMHDDASFDVELRNKYRITPLEKQFRKDQNPKKREEVTRLRAIATFFLNQIKDKAARHSDVKSLVDRGLLKSKINVLNNERTMHMETELDRKEISMANLHQIRREREAKELEKLKKTNEFGKIMRALTVTKSNSQLNVLSYGTSSVDQQIDLSQIKCREERSLYEMMASLQENLEMLDGVQEVFEKEDFGLFDSDDEENGEIVIEEDHTDMTPEKSFEQDSEEFPTLQKKVTMGKAVFISNPRSKEKQEKELTEAEKRERRNAKIAKLMHEYTAQGSGSDSDSVQQHGRSDGYKFMRTNKQLFTEKIKEPVKRNATSLMHRSQMSRPDFSDVKMAANNSVQANGREVISKHETIQNHLQDQLKMDSRQVLNDMLSKNSNNDLSEFQKQTLRHLRNSSERSEMIIYGDCMSQLERMVKTRSKQFTSAEGLPKLRKISELDPFSEKETDRNPLLHSTRQWSREDKDQHIKIAVNDSMTPQRAKQIRLLKAESAILSRAKGDSVYSSSVDMMSPTKAADSAQKFKHINKDLAKDLKGLLSHAANSRTNKHLAKLTTQSHADLSDGKKLLLMSQKAKLFVSPRRNHQMAKALVSSSGINSNMQTANRESTDITSDLQPTLDSADSVKVLPAIGQSTTTNTQSFEKPPRNLILSQTESRSSIHHNNKTSIDLQKNRQQMSSEIGIESTNKISENRFKKNFYASSDLKQKNFNSHATASSKERKPPQEWFSLTQNQHKLVDYNYAGYIAPLKPTAKEVRESFFNSRQDAAKNIAAAKSKSALIKKIVEKAKQSQQRKTVNVEDSGRRRNSRNAATIGSKEVRQIHSVVVDDNQIVNDQEASDQVPSTIENFGSPEVVTDFGGTPLETELTTLRPSKIKKQKSTKKSKSPVRNSKNQKQMQSINSLSKINIADSQVISELPQPRVVRQQIVTIPKNYADLKSLSSLQLQSENHSQRELQPMVQGPTLAAAQARSMSRKPINKLKHSEALYLKQRKNSQSELMGIFGDALNRKSKRNASRLGQPASDHNVLSYQPEGEAMVVQMKDQSVGQQSFMEASGFGKSVGANQDSIGSESSAGRRTKQRPIYRGVVEPKRDISSSSHNVLKSLTGQNPDLERELKSYGHIGVATPPDSKGKATKLGKTGYTYYSNNTQQSYIQDGSVPQSEMPEYNQAQYANQQQQQMMALSSDKPGSSQKKESSPFQQFQERIRKLQMYQPAPNVGLNSFAEYQQSTPLFRNQTKKSTAQSFAGMSTGAKKLFAQSKQSWSHNFGMATASNNSAAQFQHVNTDQSAALNISAESASSGVAAPTKQPQQPKATALAEKEQLPAMMVGKKINLAESSHKTRLSNTKMPPVKAPNEERAKSAEAVPESKETGQGHISESRIMSSELASGFNQPSTLLYIEGGGTLQVNESKFIVGNEIDSQKSGTLQGETNANEQNTSKVPTPTEIIHQREFTLNSRANVASVDQTPSAQHRENEMLGFGTATESQKLHHEKKSAQDKRQKNQL